MEFGVCECCENKIESKYGSGRFCCEKCARCFSTKSKRLEINKKVQITMLGGKMKEDKFCLECGNQFEYNRKDKKFCTIKCSAIHINKQDSTKIRLSEWRTKYLENNKGIKWMESVNLNGEIIKVQGSWELEFANKMNDLGILYKRKPVTFLNCHKYTPDFYLPLYDIYVEVKGFLYEKDKYKMIKCVGDTKIDLRIIRGINEIKSIINVEKIEKVIDLYNEENIDFSKFERRY